MSLSFLALIGIVFIANTIEALVGFGSTILTLTFAGFFIPLENLIQILVPLNLLLSALICLREWKAIDFKLLFTRILPLCLLGMPIGIWATQNISGQALKIIFGVSILWIGLRALIQIYQKSQPLTSSKWNSLYLVLGGVLQGLYASGGPFVVAYLGKLNLNKNTFRTTLSFLWLILNAILTYSLYHQDQLKSSVLSDSLQLIPSVLLGLWMGMKLHHRIPQAKFTLWIYWILTLAGICRIYLAIKG